LSYLRQDWCKGAPRFVDEFVFGYTRDVISKGGVGTWDAPIAADGLIPEAFVRQLKLLGRG